MRDDGQGFGPSPEAGLPHWGPRRTRERAELRGGTLRVDTLGAVIPLARFR